MKRLITAVAILPFVFVAGSALAAAAAPTTPDVTILKAVSDAIVASAAKILPHAIGWLGALMALQFVLTNLSLIKSGAELEAVFGKLIGSFGWFGFCIYLMNEGPGFIDGVGNSVLNKFAANIPSPTSILLSTFGICAALLGAIAIVGTSILGSGNAAIANVLVFILLAIFFIGIYMAAKIAMLYLEIGLIVALAPLSFSFLGLNALRDQGIAPLKSLIALIYRIVLLGILCGAYAVITKDLAAAFKNLSWDPSTFGDAGLALLKAFCAFPFLTFFVFKSDSIAATLAGGGSSLGTGDIASAAAAGAAVGAAMSSGSAGVLGAAARVPQSMSAVLGNMMGGNGGSVSNASASGSGSTSAAKPPVPVASLGGGQSGQPPAPTFRTNKSGAPQAPESSNASSLPPAQQSADSKSADAFEKQNTQATSGGSAQDAEIGGRQDAGLSKAIEALTDKLGQQNRKPTFRDDLKSVGQHVASEKATTSASVHTHHHD